MLTVDELIDVFLSNDDVLMAVATAYREHGVIKAVITARDDIKAVIAARGEVEHCPVGCCRDAIEQLAGDYGWLANESRYPPPTVNPVEALAMLDGSVEDAVRAVWSESVRYHEREQRRRAYAQRRLQDYGFDQVEVRAAVLRVMREEDVEEEDVLQARQNLTTHDRILLRR